MELHYCSQFLFKINAFVVKKIPQQRDTYVTYIKNKLKLASGGPCILFKWTTQSTLVFATTPHKSFSLLLINR